LVRIEGGPLRAVADHEGAVFRAGINRLRRGSPTPDRLVLISPWLDATVSYPASADIAVPAAGVELLRVGARLWADDADPAHPQVSPLFGSMAGLPPIVIFVGTFDVLYPDTVRLQQRALAEGISVETIVADGLVHVWPLYAPSPRLGQFRSRLFTALIG
jgi:triacylglycerol lipase